MVKIIKNNSESEFQVRCKNDKHLLYKILQNCIEIKCRSCKKVYKVKSQHIINCINTLLLEIKNKENCNGN